MMPFVDFFRRAWALNLGFLPILKTLLGVVLGLSLLTQSALAAEPLLTIKQLMVGVITPATNTIWGAYQLESDAQWKEVENAALTVIAAGNLLQSGGSGDEEKLMTAQEHWQRYTSEMISASRKVLDAVAAKDEDALSSAGNDDLYPPCESCHQHYQNP